MLRSELATAEAEVTRLRAHMGVPPAGSAGSVSSASPVLGDGAGSAPSPTDAADLTRADEPGHLRVHESDLSRSASSARAPWRLSGSSPAQREFMGSLASRRTSGSLARDVSNSRPTSPPLRERVISIASRRSSSSLPPGARESSSSPAARGSGTPLFARGRLQRSRDSVDAGRKDGAGEGHTPGLGRPRNRSNTRRPRLLRERRRANVRPAKLGWDAGDGGADGSGAAGHEDEEEEVEGGLPFSLGLLTRVPLETRSPWRRDVDPRTLVPFLKLSEDGRSSVWLARQDSSTAAPSAGRLLVLKMFSAAQLMARATGGEEALTPIQHVTEHIAGMQAVASVWLERDALRALSGHPFVVGVCGTRATAHSAMLAFEPCLGGSLGERVRAHGPLDARAAAFHAAALVLAIGAVHETLGCVFNALTPDAVLIDAQGWPRLSSFGALARVAIGAGSGAPTGRVLDSVDVKQLRAAADFGAPELLAPHDQRVGHTTLASAGGAGGSSTGMVGDAEQRGYGVAADWWSVGAVLFYALVGRPPRTPLRPLPGAAPRAPDGGKGVGAVVWPHAYEPELAPSARSLLEALLHPDSEARLGAPTAGGVARVRAHPFFAQHGVDWDAMLARVGVRPPWQPELRGPDDYSLLKPKDRAAAGALGPDNRPAHARDGDGEAAGWRSQLDELSLPTALSTTFAGLFHGF